MLEVKIKRLSDTAIMPTKAHPTDACFDLYADTYGEDITISPHATVKISTGIATEIPHGYWGAVFARSGLASKQGLRPAQGVPVIDEPYRGCWMVPLHNDTNAVQVVHHGDRIAQFTLLPYPDIELVEVDELDETDRGSNGFGSTGE